MQGERDLQIPQPQLTWNSTGANALGQAFHGLINPWGPSQGGPPPPPIPLGKRPWGAGAGKYVGRHPKASELCPRRGKPRETSVDARNVADVQIARPTWV